MMRLIVVCFFFVALLLNAAPSLAQISVAITFPLSTTTQGVAGVGWLIDINLAATNTASNSLLAPPAYSPSLRNPTAGAIDPSATGLVVLLSTTPNNGATLLGPLTNIAGLFQINAPAVSSAGLNQFRVLWFVGSSAFGLGVSSTLTAFVVSGQAPTLVPADPSQTPNIISNIAVTQFNISSRTSLTADTSVLTGNTTANPSAINIVVFTPRTGDVLGLNAFNFIIDFRAIVTDPQFNPLLSNNTGYVPLFATGSNPNISRPGFNLGAPGVVVLLNTTTLGAGPNTNLAGVFQMNAINTAATSAGAVNEIWMTWIATAALFGSGPSQLTIYILNTTAPTVVVGSPQSQVGLISNIVTVNFFIAPPTGNVVGDPSFTGFHGQKAFQVHGIPGAVFNILTAPSLQLNALFTFIDRGEALSAAEMTRARRVSAVVERMLPVTQPWSHPGTYLSQLGLKLGSLELLIVAGSYTSGVAFVTLVSENRNLTAGETVRHGNISVAMLDSSRVQITHTLLRFTIVNSDRFFNLEHAELINPEAHNQLDGLLGQSANPDWKADEGRDFEEHMMMDYLVLEDGQSAESLLFSNDFRANRFVESS